MAGPNSPLDQDIHLPDLSTPKPPEPTQEEKDLAQVAKSPGWQHILKYLEGRAEYYRAYLPNHVLSKDGAIPKSVAQADMSDEEIGRMWRAACIIIGEIETLKSQMENYAGIKRPSVR